jgi:hypothetical protein
MGAVVTLFLIVLDLWSEAEQTIEFSISAFVQAFGRRHYEPSTRSGGRRLKSAKARNRGN